MRKCGTDATGWLFVIFFHMPFTGSECNQATTSDSPKKQQWIGAFYFVNPKEIFSHEGASCERFLLLAGAILNPIGIEASVPRPQLRQQLELD